MVRRMRGVTQARPRHIGRVNGGITGGTQDIILHLRGTGTGEAVNASLEVFRLTASGAQAQRRHGRPMAAVRLLELHHYRALYRVRVDNRP